MGHHGLKITRLKTKSKLFKIGNVSSSDIDTERNASVGALCILNFQVRHVCPEIMQEKIPTFEKKKRGQKSTFLVLVTPLAHFSVFSIYWVPWRSSV